MVVKIAVTGLGGFLGLHVRAAARALDIEVAGIGLGDKYDELAARDALAGADRVIHLAGVNRGTETEVIDGNAQFATQLVSAIERSGQSPASIVFANSVQAGNGTAYGTAKQHAAESLAAAAQRSGAVFENILLPNLFGEYGRPFYNSVVATFSYLTALGESPIVHEDKQLQLLHAQDAADLLLGSVAVDQLTKRSRWETVSDVKRLLGEFAEIYSAGEFPDLSSAFRRDLFNTYRSYTFPANGLVDVTRHADQRGAFFEIVRSHGGTGQTSFSTSVPGVTRGDHFHLRKIERFTVLAGEAEIRLRRLFDDKVYAYRISGDEPKSVDMPTLYSHAISNVGTDTLYTAFWSNDIYDPTNPDTIAEVV